MSVKLTKKCRNCDTLIRKSKTYCSDACKEEYRKHQEREQMLRRMTVPTSTTIYDPINDCGEWRSIRDIATSANVNPFLFARCLGEVFYAGATSPDEVFYMHPDDCRIFLPVLADWMKWQAEDKGDRYQHSPKCLEWYFWDWYQSRLYSPDVSVMDTLLALYLVDIVEHHLCGYSGFAGMFSSLKHIRLRPAIKEENQRRAHERIDSSAKRQFTQNTGSCVYRAKVPEGGSVEGYRHSGDTRLEEAKLTAGDEFYLHVWRCPFSSDWGGDGVYRFTVDEPYADERIIRPFVYGNWVGDERVPHYLYDYHSSHGGEVPISWLTHTIHGLSRGPDNIIQKPIVHGSFDDAVEQVFPK